MKHTALKHMPSPKDFRCVQIDLDRSKDDFLLNLALLPGPSIGLKLFWTGPNVLEM